MLNIELCSREVGKHLMTCISDSAYSTRQGKNLIANSTRKEASLS